MSAQRRIGTGARVVTRRSRPNGEVEGPHRSARSEPRGHTVFSHPRRHYRLSRPPPTIVRRTRVHINFRNMESIEVHTHVTNESATRAPRRSVKHGRANIDALS